MAWLSVNANNKEVISDSCSYNDSYCCSYIYFKSEEAAKQAIEILGEETIRLALSTDW